MKTFIFPRLSLVVICAFIFQMSVGFSGFRWDGESHDENLSALKGYPAVPGDPRELFFGRSHRGFTGVREASALDTASFQDLLFQYNAYMELMVEDAFLIYDNVQALNSAIQEEDMISVDFLIDEQTLLIETLMDSAEALYGLETNIQMAMGTGEAARVDPRSGPRIEPVTIIVGTLAIYSIYKYGKGLTEANKNASEARNKWFEAESGSKEAKAAHDELIKAGQKATLEVGTQTSGALIFGGVNPTSAVGKLIKAGAEQGYDKGLEVITATPECKNGLKDPGCKIGVGKTDSEGKVTVPAGKKMEVIIAGKTEAGTAGQARKVVEATVIKNGTTTVSTKPLTISEATPEKVAEAETLTATVVQTETGETVEPGTAEGDQTGDESGTGTTEPVGEGTDGGTPVGTDETGNISDFLLGSWNATLVIPGDGQPGSCMENGVNTGGSVYIREGGGVTASFGEDPTSGTWSYDGSTLTINLEGYVFSGSAPPNTAHITLSGPQGATMSLST